MLLNKSPTRGDVNGMIYGEDQPDDGTELLGTLTGIDTSTSCLIRHKTLPAQEIGVKLLDRIERFSIRCSQFLSKIE